MLFPFWEKYFTKIINKAIGFCYIVHRGWVVVCVFIIFINYDQPLSIIATIPHKFIQIFSSLSRADVIQCNKIENLAMKASHEDEKDRFLEIQNKDEQKDCLICLDPLLDTQLLKNTYCKHTYHNKCLANAIVHSPTGKYCPYCKGDLTDSITNKFFRVKIKMNKYAFYTYLSLLASCSTLLSQHYFYPSLEWFK